MLKSNYNIEKKVEDGLLIYNTFTGAIICLDEINTKYYEDGSFEKINEVNQLVEFGIIVENENSQLNELREVATRYSDHTDQLFVTILPTTSCNLRCVYCFESIRNLTMTDDIINSMIDFLRITLVENKYLKLHVTWFGGEPLLYPNIVNKAYVLIENMVDELGIELSNSIITNGTFLSDKNVALLKNMRNLDTVQITIDGCKTIHDARRPLIGTSSYDRIMHNIRTYGKDLPLAIRINIDKDNVNDVESLIKELASLYENANNLYVYFGRVVGSTSSYTPYEFATVKGDLYRILKQHNFRNSVKKFLPTIKAVQCSAITKHLLVIDANGDLYTCWEVVGESDYKIGTIFEGITKKEWKLKNNEKEECLSCKVYPICRTGCPKHYEDPLKDNCMFIPEVLINDIEGLIIND